jgi:hypothetical protein
MKTKHLVFGLTLLVLSFSACREITVTTVVNGDGSFSRIVTITGDSSEVFKPDLPYPVDSSWAMQAGKDSADTGKFIVTYTKHFRKCEELNTEILGDTGWRRQLARRIDITKRFRFFYSYLEYREVYSAANPFSALPYKDYITPEEYLWITRQKPVQNHSDSALLKAAEDKVDVYLIAAATLEAEKIMTDGFLRLNDPRLDPKRIAVFHDSVSNVFAKWDPGHPDDLIGCYSKWMDNPAVLRLHELKPPVFTDFEKKLTLLGELLFMEEFRVEAEMPGLITGTNSSVMKGNRVGWEVFPMAFMFEDYKMTAESRVINVWAFVLSGLVLFGLVILLVAKSLKK